MITTENRDNVASGTTTPIIYSETQVPFFSFVTKTAGELQATSPTLSNPSSEALALASWFLRFSVGHANAEADGWVRHRSSQKYYVSLK